MSGRKSKAAKSVDTQPKYASRLVAGVLDNLIAQKLERCKYPKATQKWLGKLRSSVLKKVSSHSKTLYVTEATNTAELRASIRSLMERIQQQRGNIERALAAQGKDSVPVLAQRLESYNAAYESGQFDGSAKRIQDQFSEVAGLLISVNPSIENTANSFESNLSTVRSQLQPVLAAMQQRKAEATRAPTSTTVGIVRGVAGAAKKGAAAPATSSSKDTMQLVNKHLVKK